jgi:NodT family efflux transporter outer membrane factor (OMF) lipoprotein
MSANSGPALRRRGPSARALRAHRLGLTLGLLCGLAASGCALGPDFHRPEAPSGDSVLPAQQRAAELAADGHAQRFDRRADLPADWWTRLGSRELDALVETALEHSPGLQSTLATLRQSEDSLRAGYGVFFPQVGADVAAQRQDSLVNLGHGLQSTGPYKLGTFGANVSYVPDLFGAQRRAQEALGAARDVQRAAVQAARLSLTANVVNTAIARAGYEAQREASVAIVQRYDEQIRLARVQYESGTGSFGAVLALRGQQAASRAAVAALEQRIDAADHLLAQLCGQPPAAFAAPHIALESLALPAELPDALPSSLVRHRPDILAAEAAVHSASAQVGVATADLFPNLTLGGTAGAGNSAISQTLRTGTRFWSMQASLAGSVFGGGTQWFTRKAAIDAYDASLAQYENTVLIALQQVADTMRALAHDAQGLDAQADALADALENRKLTSANYEAGLAGYLDMLAADAQYQQARLAYLGAVAQRLQDTVALYAALGGGWWSAAGAPAAAPSAGALPAGAP